MSSINAMAHKFRGDRIHDEMRAVLFERQRLNLAEDVCASQIGATLTQSGLSPDVFEHIARTAARYARTRLLLKGRVA